ncbi:MAG TPA: hypothetical protein VMV59_09905, partial [Candidatus Dormibacteraeota bacterium]|nr:hypothetical protein [Candidatus Dormibacteraeota bacterium]
MRRVIFRGQRRLRMLVSFLALTRRPDLANIEETLLLEPLDDVLRPRSRKWTGKHNEKLLAVLRISSRHHNHRQAVIFNSLRGILRAA